VNFLLRVAMTAMYDKFAAFYDLEYGHKEDDLDFYLSLAQQYGAPVLEIGAGTGRISMLLAEAGYEVVGMDNSMPMLKQAAQNISTLPDNEQNSIKLVLGDMRSFSLEERFPLCIVPFRAFLHNQTQEEQLQTLQCIYDHLTPSGVLAIDVFVPLYHVIENSAWDDEINQDELADPEAGVSISCHIEHNPAIQVLAIQNTYRQDGKKDKICKMKYRYVFRYEMELLLKLAGFEVIQVLGSFEKAPYNYFSGTAIFLARKRA